MTDQMNAPEKAANEEALSADDLSLIGQADEDAVKSEDDIWNELENEEAGTPETDVAASETLPESEEPPAAPEAAGDEEGAPEAATAADSEQTSEGDIWVNATPEQREAYDALLQQRRSEDGRIAAYQQQVRDLRKQLAAPPIGRTGTDTKSVKDALKQVEGISEDFPEIAGPLKTALEAVNKGFEHIDAEEEYRRRAVRESEARDAEFETARLNEMLPGWGHFIDSNEAAFNEWLQHPRCPQGLAQAARRNANGIVNADEAYHVVREFHQYLSAAAPAQEPATEPQPEPKTQQLDGRQQRRLEALDSPRVSGSKPVVSGIPEDGDPETIWKQMEAEEARAAARA